MKQDVDAHLRQTVSALIRSSNKSRSQIADELSSILDAKVTVNILNGFTAKSKWGVRFPAAWIPALCEVLHDNTLERVFLSERSLRLLEWAELNLNVAVSLKKLEAARQTLLNDLGECSLKGDFQ